MHVDDRLNVPQKFGSPESPVERVLVNVAHPVDEPDIFLQDQIQRLAKPHQIGGIRFMYDNLVENLDRYKASRGFGCILAHAMGLGKTMQVISFCDIFLKHTSAKRILCIVPMNTIQHWFAEFEKWLPSSLECQTDKSYGDYTFKDFRNFHVHLLNDA